MLRHCVKNAWLFLFLLTILSGIAAPGARSAQETPTVRTPPPQQIEKPADTPEPLATSDTDRYTLSHERYEKAVAYSRAGYTLYFLSVFIGFAVLILALRYGFVAQVRDMAQRTTENRFLQGLIFIPILGFLLDVVDLPVHIAWHGLSLHYEQSVQRWPSWILDWSKGELINLSFLVLMGMILFLVIRKSPRRWWFYFWLAALPIILAIFVLQPIVIDPLFYQFQPLVDSNPQLAADLEKLTERAGLQIPRERMFLMNASAKTNEINAYVTGFGASKRVVIYDNTIKKLTPQETLFVFGHESGHYVLNHIRDGFLFFAVVLLLAFYICYRLLNRFIDRWGARCRIYGPQEWAALAVLLLILQGITFLSSPVINAFSRSQEHAADVFGLELTHGIIPHSSQVAAHAFQALGEIDLSDPNPPPFITFWMYSHPPLAERLVFAHTYDPWSKNQSPKYVK